MNRRAIRALVLCASSAALVALAFSQGCSCGEKPNARRSSGDDQRPGKKIRAERRPPPAERRVLPEGTIAALQGDVTLDARDRRPPPSRTAGDPGSRGTGEDDHAREDEHEGEGDEGEGDGHEDDGRAGERPGGRAAATEGAELYIGDAVITGDDGSATIRTTDGAEVFVGPRTMLVIEPYGAGQLMIPRGRVRVYLPPTGPRRRPVNVVTYAGITSIASGDLVVAARADGAVRLEVLTGSVSTDLAAGPTTEPAALTREPVQVTAGKRLDLVPPAAGADAPRPVAVDGSGGLEDTNRAADAWIAEVTAPPTPLERSRALLDRAVAEGTALFANIERRREETVRLHEAHRQAIASKSGQSEAQQRIIENARALFKLNSAGRAVWGRVRAALLMGEDGAVSTYDAGGPTTAYSELVTRATSVFRRTHRGPPGRRNFPQLPVKVDPNKIRVPGARVPLDEQAETRPR